MKETVEENEDGNYEVVQPVNGATPEHIEFTIDGVTYRFSDFQGTNGHSRIYPDVLLYGQKEVIAE
jgi:hypothetical protein